MTTSQTFEFLPSTKKVNNGTSVKVTIETDKLGTVKIDGTAVKVETIDYLLAYGLKQSLSDSYASAKDQAEFDAMLFKRLTKILEGTMGIREAGAPRDPFEAECIRLAKLRLAAIAKKQGKTLPKVASDAYKAMLETVRNGKARDKIESEARENLAAIDAIDVDEDEIDFDEVESDDDESDEVESDDDEVEAAPSKK